MPWCFFSPLVLGIKPKVLPLNEVPSHSLCLVSYLSGYNVCIISPCWMYSIRVDHTNIAWVLLEALLCARYVLNEDLPSPVILLSWSLAHGGTTFYRTVEHPLRIGLRQLQ